MAKKSCTVSRRWFLAGLLACTAPSALAGALKRSPVPPPRPGATLKAGVPEAEALVARAGLSGQVAFALADARTGEILEARNPLLPLPPASTAKTITTLYALETLGPDFRFQTRLLGTGPVKNGRLAGDLILAGGGDPTLDSDMLGTLAMRLKKAGVREVAGRFLYHDAALPRLRMIDQGQPVTAGYNPAISGLNLNFNRVRFHWARASDGWDVTMNAQARRYGPQVSVTRMRVVDRQMPVYTYSGGMGGDEWTVASGALGSDGSRWLPVRRPSIYAAEVFQTLARSHGIDLPQAQRVGDLPVGATMLADLPSAPLSVILRDMLKFSTNLTAEAVGLTASESRGARGASLVDSADEMNDWARAELGLRHARFVDHSGLGDSARITAGDMVRALVRAGPDGALNKLMKEVHMRDRQGRPIRDGEVTVHAKTGTLNFASGLVGYLRAGDGRPLAFAIYAADLARRDGLSPAERDHPPGGRAWLGAARRLQMDLIDRWAVLHSG